MKGGVAITAADITWELQPLPDIVPTDGDLLTDAIVEAQSYRQLAQSALHGLHAVQIERDILRGQLNLDRRRRKAAAA